MALLDPVWLLLAIPLAASLWLWRLPGRLLVAVRVLWLTCLLLALAGLAIQLPSKAGTVVVVVDHSDSMPPGAEARHKLSIEQIQKAMGPDDRLAVIAFGENAVLEHRPESGKFVDFVGQVGKGASNLAEAIEKALALIPPDSPGRILILSDGRWTGRDPAGVSAWASARGVALDHRHEERPAANDVAVTRVDAPPRVGQGESFTIAAWVRVPSDQKITWKLYRDRRGNSPPIAQVEEELKAGLHRRTFRDQAGRATTHVYEVEVEGTGNDELRQNNTGKFLVGVDGLKPLLHVSTLEKSGLATLLSAGKVSIHSVKPEQVPTDLEGLSKYSGILLENVPADALGLARLQAIAAWVRDLGTGLMMTGGRESFGTGGYIRSPIEPILPLSMELRPEHRKLAVSIAVALDRSGSMMAPVAGGKRKMDLANVGTAKVVELLSEHDEVGVFAVDTSAHVVAELSRLRDKAALKDRILRIQSQGGGIFVYEALVACHRMLQKATNGTRHIILFADADDAEHPDKWEQVVRQCRAESITVSVIGLGTEKSKDAQLLKDIATAGGGRCFFTDNAEELPRLFSQEAFAVARSTFVEAKPPVRIEARPGLSRILGQAMKVDRHLGGYNLCTLRQPEANLGVEARDEYKTPIVANWQVGLGRVVCYTGVADDPRYAGDMPQWKDVGEFFSSLARWTMGELSPLPDGMVLTQEVKNGVSSIRLHLDPNRQRESFAGQPRVNIVRQSPGREPVTTTARMRWSGADELLLEVPIHGDETVLTAVEIPGLKPVTLPPACLLYSPEFRPAEGATGLVTLDRLARATGGKERLELATVWADLERRPRLIPAASWLILAAVVLFLLEVLERRTSLLSRFRRLTWAEEVPAAAKQPAREKAAAGGWFGWLRRKKPKPEATPLPETPALPSVAPTPAGLPDRVTVVEALQRTRQRIEGRFKKSE